ncbi:hypothetical protein PFISCL1PPCAC_5157, partial [Pristionchus fissidentatus]
SMEMHRDYIRNFGYLATYKNILDLAKSPFRMLIYHGDTDLVISAMTNAYCTNKIAEENRMKDLEVNPSWHFFGDFAGALTSYKSWSKNITMDFLTVR